MEIEKFLFIIRYLLLVDPLVDRILVKMFAVSTHLKVKFSTDTI